jgi:hypothetical protein
MICNIFKIKHIYPDLFFFLFNLIFIFIYLISFSINKIHDYIDNEFIIYFLFFYKISTIEN